MIFDLLLDYIGEAVTGRSRSKGRTNLPDAQERFYTFWKENASQYFGLKVVNQYDVNFWLLSNGEFVYSEQHHFESARIAGTTMEEMGESGAIRGTNFSELGFEITVGSTPTEKQIDSVKDYISITKKEIVVDFYDPRRQNWKAAYVIDKDIDSEILRKILLGNGDTKEYRSAEFLKALNGSKERVSGRPIREAVATEVLPEPQQKLVDKFGSLSAPVGGKFFLLSNGESVFVDDEHRSTAIEAGTNVDALLISGAIRAYESSHGYLVYEIDQDVRPTDQQLHFIENAFQRNTKAQDLTIEFSYELGRIWDPFASYVVKKQELVEDPDKLYKILTSHGRAKYPVVEATAADIARKQKTITSLFPVFPDRVKAIGKKGGVRLKAMDPEGWDFKVHSGTKDQVWYDIRVEFKDAEALVGQLVRDRRLWLPDKSRIDYNKLSQEFLNRANIQLSCTCPAELYWGGDYILSLSKYDAKYGKRELRPPRVRNPKQYGAHCKHIQAMFKTLPFYAGTAAKWLKDFHGEQIAKAEKAATRTKAAAARAAAGLKKRMEK